MRPRSCVQPRRPGCLPYRARSLSEHCPAATVAEQDVVPSLTTTTTISADLPDASGVGAGTVTVTDGVDSCAAAVADGKCSITLTTAGSRMLTATYARAIATSAPGARVRSSTRSTRRAARAAACRLNTVRFSGWLSRGKKLTPGRYILVMTAVTPGVGETSQRLRFSVVR